LGGTVRRLWRLCLESVFPASGGAHPLCRCPKRRADRPPAVRPPSAAAWPPARRLCLECRKRLPGQERTGTPANDVEDYLLVVD